MLFTKTFVALCALSPLAYASPLSSHRRQPAAVPALVTRQGASNVTVNSFNNWHNNDNLNGFDDFFGNDNFSGKKNKQTIIVEEKLVCSKRDLKVVQQKLNILLEVSKRILLEQACDVVTQVIIIQQINQRYRQFGNDVGRKSGRQVGYDKNVASKVDQLFDPSTGDLSFSDLGFSGLDIGSSLAQFNDNWDDSSSPDEVAAALDAVAQAVLGQSQGDSSGEQAKDSAPEVPEAAAPPAPVAPPAAEPSASAAPARRRFWR